MRQRQTPCTGSTDQLKRKKTSNINQNAGILALLMFKTTTITKKRIKSHFAVDCSFFFLFSEANSDFSAGFLF